MGAVSLAQWPPSQGGHNLQRRQIGLVLIFAQIGSFLCDDYPAPITQVHFEVDSNIDTDENMDIITKSGNPIVEIRKIEIRKNERQTSQDNSNELNLEEIETDSAKKGKMLSGGGGKNKKL